MADFAAQDALDAGARFARRYHAILCDDAPSFIAEYAGTALVRRLGGVGLLCGTDWTPLFQNRFFYSRLQHSVGVALVVWHFTHDKKQAIAGLLHDVSNRAFSHVTDFRNGDTLRQESTEDINARLIDEDAELAALLNRDGMFAGEVDDYHAYPVADNDCPGLSADRLEYMYPSGAALCGAWSLDDIARNYGRITVLQNERGVAELGFDALDAAEEYVARFCAISRILQTNEDKLALNLLGDVVNRAIATSLITEQDLFSMPEREIIALFDREAERGRDREFCRLHRTFRTMRSVLHTQEPLAGHYCVRLDVKKRYVDPLVRVTGGTVARASTLSPAAAQSIQDFLSYRDTPYGCVPLCHP